MTDLAKTTERDDVLFAFHQAYERPEAKDITEWVRRYPQFAEDIRAHAAVARDWAARENDHEEAVNETMSARAYSRALNIIHNSEREVVNAETSLSSPTFQQMQAAVGKETHHLATELDVSRGVLSDLFNGVMKPPIRTRLANAVLTALNVSREEFEQALQYTLQAPRMNHAKSHHTPSIIARPCDDIIRDSSMSDARKRYWLEED